MPQSVDTRDARRAQLLGVALDLFAEKGYHATSIADIIDRASVARGTFYNYFDSKRQIFEKLLNQLFDSISRVVSPISTGSPAEVYEQTRGNIQGICDALRSNLPMARVLLEQAVGLDAEANQQLRSFYGRIVDRLQNAIEDGQALGIVREGNPAVLATCLLGMVKESLYQQLLGTRQVDIDDLVGEIFRVAVEGILVINAE